MKRISREDIEAMYPISRDLTEQEIKMIKMPVTGDTKFTPGPWKLDYSDQLEWALSSDNYEITSGFADYSPSKVDAQLMASAPDLYEALEEILEINIRSMGWQGNTR